VRHKTELAPGYRVYAAWQNMQYFVDDWEKAERRLKRRIELLKLLVEERKRQEADGSWKDVVAVYEKGQQCSSITT
jgi:hypothetical protein